MRAAGTAWSPDCTAGLSQTSLAIGWWLYVYGYMFAARTNLFRYNFPALGFDFAYFSTSSLLTMTMASMATNGTQK